jgi:hypothetical protein
MLGQSLSDDPADGTGSLAVNYLYLVEPGHHGIVQVLV